MKFDSDGGFYRYTVKNLPAGIKFTTNSKDNNICYFTGVPTAISSPATTVTAKDERGNIYIVKIVWNIYNDSTIAAGYETRCFNIDFGYPSVDVENRVQKPVGGSGEYTYAIEGSNYGLSINSAGTVSGTMSKPGTYKLSATTSRADSFDKMAVITATVTSKTTSLTAKVYSRTVNITEGKGVTTYVGRFYRFVPKTSGTYYFYSISYNRTPRAFLYDGDTGKMLDLKNGGGHGLSENINDFCLSYECEAGKAYLIEVEGSSCSMYISSVSP